MKGHRPRREPPRRPAPGRPRASGLELHAPEGAPAPRWMDLAGWTLIGFYALALLWVAFRLHVVGDYYTESDFYGGYAEGARLIQQGRPDPSRYPVVGPGYDAALALVGFVVRDLFTAARLISVAGAVGTVLLWRALLERRAGGALAWWTVAFLATNHVLFRYAHSATTDVLALFLQAVALQAMFGSTGRLAPLRAGVFAAVATLTRYNSVYLLPAGLLGALWLAPPAEGSRRRAALLQLGGFALIAAPWVAFSLARGHVPGASLFGNFHTFYTVADNTRNVQDQTSAVADSLAALRSQPTAPGSGVLGLVLESLRNLPEHLIRDASETLGLMLAALCVLGLAFAIADGTWRRLLPVWIAGAMLFATLAPVFYSDRYSMAIAPYYLTLAAAAVSSRLLALRVSPPGFSIKWLLALVSLAISARDNAAYQKRVLSNLPTEVLEAGRALESASSPGERVLSRKAQIGYYAHRPVLAFPRLSSFTELGEYCRQRDIRYLYFSWYEARLRPEFVYLIDTTAVFPGLSVIHVARHNPAVLYRVGPEFGRAPAWFASATEQRRHLARSYVLVMPDSEAAASHLLLGAYALDEGNDAAALEHFDAASRSRPDDPMVWHLSGEALRELGRLPEAVRAYRHALTLDSTKIRARLGLGWSLLGTGDVRSAATVWRPAIGSAQADTMTLRQMAEIYDQLGDREAATAARAARAARLGARPPAGRP